MSSAEENQNDWPWPDALDAMIAAPASHRLLLENEEVRVLEVRIAPGETVPVHTHKWPFVMYSLGGKHFVRRDSQGKVLLDSRNMPGLPDAGMAAWCPPLPPHSVENVGDTEIRNINIELKTAGL